MPDVSPGGVGFPSQPQAHGVESSKADQWADYREQRDTAYHARLATEERFQRISGDLADEIAAGGRRFAAADLFGGHHAMEEGPGRLHAEETYRDALRGQFEEMARHAGAEGVSPAQWHTAHAAVREGMTRFFEWGAQRERHAEMFRADFDRAVADFRDSDLFGGRYLTSGEPPSRHGGEPEDTSAARDIVREDLLEEAGRADVPRTLHDLRVRMRLQYVRAVDEAYRSDGGGHAQERAGAGLDARVARLRTELAGELEQMSVREREVEHATRVFDQMLEDWQEDLAGGGTLGEAAETRAREEFQQQLRTAHVALGGSQAHDARAQFGSRWQAHLSHQLESSVLRERLEYAQLRETRMGQARQALTEAFDRFENDLADGGALREEGRERLTTQWERSVEEGISEDWFGHRGHEDFRTPPTAESLGAALETDHGGTPGRESALTHRVSTESALGPRPNAPQEPAPRAWEQTFEELRATLHPRLSHEFDLQQVLNRAAREFHGIVGHPDSLAHHYDIDEKAVERIGNDFREETITRYDQLWARTEHDIKAWLRHERRHENAFTRSLDAARATSLDARSPRPDGPGRGPATNRADSPVSRPEDGQDDTPANQHTTVRPPENEPIPATPHPHPEATEATEATEDPLRHRRIAPLTEAELRAHAAPDGLFPDEHANLFGGTAVAPSASDDDAQAGDGARHRESGGTGAVDAPAEGPVREPESPDVDPAVDYRLIHPLDRRHVQESTASGETLWRFSDRHPLDVLREGFPAEDTAQVVRVHDWAADEPRAQFVSTTRDPGLWFLSMRYRYEIVSARNTTGPAGTGITGVDINATLRRTEQKAPFPKEREVAFTGGISAEAVVSVYDSKQKLTGELVHDTEEIFWTRGDRQNTSTDREARLPAGWGGPTTPQPALAPVRAAARTSVWASGEVRTDRWTPFGTRRGARRPGVPEAFVFSVSEDGTPVGVRRPAGSGERINVGYSWQWLRGETPAQDTLYLTRRVHLSPDGATDAEVLELRQKLTWWLDQLVNEPGHRLPVGQPDQVTGPRQPGPLLWLDVEFTDRPEDAHSAVRVLPGRPETEWSMRQRAWYTGVHPAAYVHELVHGLGVRDDEADPDMLLTPGGRGGQRLDEGVMSLMGSFAGGPGLPLMTLTDDHLGQIAAVFAPYAHGGRNTARTAAVREAAPRTDGSPADAGTSPGRELPDVETRVAPPRLRPDGAPAGLEDVPEATFWRFSNTAPETVFARGFGADRVANAVDLPDLAAEGARARSGSMSRDVGILFQGRRYRYRVEPSPTPDPAGAAAGDTGEAQDTRAREEATGARVTAPAAVTGVYDRQEDRTGTWDAGTGTVLWRPGSADGWAPETDEDLDPPARHTANAASTSAGAVTAQERPAVRRDAEAADRGIVENWVDLSSLPGKTRSRGLKAVDAAVRTVAEHPGDPGAVRRALNAIQDWESGKGGGSDRREAVERLRRELVRLLDAGRGAAAQIPPVPRAARSPLAPQPHIAAPRAGRAAQVPLVEGQAGAAGFEAELHEYGVLLPPDASNGEYDVLVDTPTLTITLDTGVVGPILEVVSKATRVLSGAADDGRQEKSEVFAQFDDVLTRLGNARANDQLDRVFPAKAGYRVDPVAGGLRLRPAAKGLTERVFLHYIVGIPLAGMIPFLEHVRLQGRKDSAITRAAQGHLADALRFGREAAAPFQRWLAAHPEFQVQPDDAPALEGFLALAYTQTAALAQGTLSSVITPKNFSAVASRVSLAGTRAGLGTAGQSYLEEHATAIAQHFAASFRSYFKEVRDVPDLLADRIPSRWAGDRQSPGTIGQYLADALLSPPDQSLGQNAALGIRTDFQELDHNRLPDGTPRLDPPVVVLELRSYGKHYASRQDLLDNYEKLEGQALRLYNEARRLRGLEVVGRLLPVAAGPVPGPSGPGRARRPIEHRLVGGAPRAGQDVDVDPAAAPRPSVAALRHRLAEGYDFGRGPGLGDDPDAAAIARIIGPDLYGQRQAPPAPSFLEGYDFARLKSAQRAAFFTAVDMTRRVAPLAQEVLPSALRRDPGTVVESGRRSMNRATARGLRKAVRIPRLVHTVWLGGPLRDHGATAGFRRNIAAMAAGQPDFTVVLWTDVPREEISAARAAAKRPADATARSRRTTDVLDMLGWARAAGVRLVNVDEIFSDASPMELEGIYKAEESRRTGAAYAAASDVLRLEILARFGGVYTDGDNTVSGDLAGEVRRVADSAHGFGMGDDGAGRLSNAIVIAPAGHGFLTPYRDVIRGNYTRTAYENMFRAKQLLIGGEAGDDRSELRPLAPEVLGRTRRTVRDEVLYRTGPSSGVMRPLARRIGLPDRLDGLLPLSPRVFTVNSAQSWLPPDTPATPAPVAAEPHDAEEAAQVAREALVFLVQGLHRQPGNLDLAGVAPAVRGLPRPDDLWDAVIGFLAERAELRGLVRSVTLDTLDARESGIVDTVSLPAWSGRLLEILHEAPRDALAAHVHPARLHAPGEPGQVRPEYARLRKDERNQLFTEASGYLPSPPLIGRDAWSEALREAHRAQVTEVARVLHTQGREAALRLAGQLAAGSAARVRPGGSADSADEAGSRTGEPSPRSDAELDDLYGPAVGPKRVKGPELYPGERGTVRPHPLLRYLHEVPTPVLTSDRDVVWLYVVTEDGEIALGSEDVTGAMGEEAFGALLAGVRRIEPDMTAERLRELLDGLGHTGLAVRFGPDGDTFVGRGRIAGEFAWNDGAWTVNDKSGRYMSNKVRPGLTTEQSAVWLANVARRFSTRLGVEVRPVPYKERPKTAGAGQAGPQATAPAGGFAPDLVAEVRRELRELTGSGDHAVDEELVELLREQLFGQGTQPVMRDTAARIALAIQSPGARPKLLGGGKKGNNKNKKNSKGSKGDRGATGSGTAQREAGSSRGAAESPQVELTPVPKGTNDAVIDSVDRLLTATRPDQQRQEVVAFVIRLMERLPYPDVETVDRLIVAVDWLRDASGELRERMLSHPHVMYAAARRFGLLRLLDRHPPLTDVLSESPVVLDALTDATDDWHAAQPEQTSEILARREVIGVLEADPVLRRQLFVNEHMLHHFDGRTDILRHVLQVRGDVQQLAHISAEFASAILSLDDPAEALWRLGSDAALSSALRTRAARGDGGDEAFFRTVLEDEALAAVLRPYPEQLNVVLSSQRILDVVRARPTVLGILQRSWDLTDVLEDMPDVALRLLSDERRITAAVDNPAVAVALSYNPGHYDAIDDLQLVSELRATRLPEKPLPGAESRPAALSEEQINTSSGPALLAYLRAVNPAFAAVFTRPGDRQLVREVFERRDVDLIRRLARQPDAITLPHIVRRVLSAESADLTLPADDTVARTLMLTAFRHEGVAVLYFDDERSEERPLLDSMIAESPEFGSLLYRSPRLAYLAFNDMRPLQLLPATSLAEDPWLAAALQHAPWLITQLQQPPHPSMTTALAAEDSALIRLIYRHAELSRKLDNDEWRIVVEQVMSAPRLLNSLLHAYGRMSATHWRELLLGRMFTVLARQLGVAVDGDPERSADESRIDAWPGRPTALALVTFPEVLREAVARPDFVEAWEANPAQFDHHASRALAAHPKRTRGKDTARTGSEALSGLLDAVKTLGGQPLITEEGYELDPEYAKALDLVLHRLEHGDTPEQYRAVLAAEGYIEDADAADAMDVYRAVLRDDRLRRAALDSRYLAQNLFFTEGVVELMTTRPSLLDQFEGSPQVLRQIAEVEGLARLLTHDDRSFAVFNDAAGTRANFDQFLVRILEHNSEYAEAVMKRSRQLARPDFAHVTRFVEASPATTRAVIDRAETFDVLTRSPELLKELRAADEDVVRAVMATQGRLNASAARPELVSRLSQAAALASALGDLTGIATDAVDWQELVGNAALVRQFGEHPELVGTVLGEPELLRVVMAAPAFVGVLAGTADGARARLTRHEMLRLVLRSPGLADALAENAGLRSAFVLPGLAELLTYRSDVLDALRKRPDLVGALHQNR
ncbi:glycosyltransferase, partial [Streptomyces olivochromogenes]|uniref:scabin-related ADP-ribosyltransferase n=1 Tax=Streptomyces olivochromogenes TaxID=1963 RepID=UPI0036D97306